MIEKTPRNVQFGKKSAKVYHCLYSLLMQLQVALWTYMFLKLGLNNEKSLLISLCNLSLSYLSYFILSLSKPSVSYPWAVW